MYSQHSAHSNPTTQNMQFQRQLLLRMLWIERTYIHGGTQNKKPKRIQAWRKSSIQMSQPLDWEEIQQRRIQQQEHQPDKFLPPKSAFSIADNNHRIRSSNIFNRFTHRSRTCRTWIMGNIYFAKAPRVKEWGGGGWRMQDSSNTAHLSLHSYVKRCCIVVCVDSFVLMTDAFVTE